MNNENLVSILRGLSNDLVDTDALVYKNALYYAAERIEQLETKLKQKEQDKIDLQYVINTFQQRYQSDLYPDKIASR